MSQVQVWDFRANEDYYEREALQAFLHKIGKKFAYQLEMSESGYRHWQGRVSLWKVKRKNELMNMMKGMDMPIPNYLEPTTTQEHKTTAFYCLKEDSRIGGPWTDKDSAQYIPRQYRDLVLYPYQQQIIDSRLTFDKRCVDCVVDEGGNIGKSTCASIGDLLHGGIDLPPINDGEKLTISLCNILIAKDEHKPGIVFFDLPRAVEQTKLSGMFTAIEQIKKGKVWDWRNSYKDWWFDSPRVWVFVNEFPYTGYLTPDRWRFWRITADKELERIYAPVSDNMAIDMI